MSWRRHDDARVAPPALGIHDLNQFTPDITLWPAQVVFRVGFGAVSV